MALIEKLSRINKENQREHDPIDCFYSIFKAKNGNTYLQLDTHGRNGRQITGKISQTLQFNEISGRELKKLLEETFSE